MKKLLIIIAALLPLVSCSGDGEKSAAATDSGEIVLETEADSLGYYLAEAMVDLVRERLDSVPADKMDNFDSEKFNRAVSAMLNSSNNHTGYYYGALHGANINDQICLLRSAGVRVSAEQFIAGFGKGLTAGRMSAPDSVALSKLMTPVNNRLIIEKRKTSRNNNFRKADGTMFKVD